MSGVALVSGAGGGIGREVVDQLLQRGDRVIATDLRAEAVQTVARERAWPETRVEIRALDVRKADAWEAVIKVALDQWGRLDQLYNVAGYLKPGKIHEAPVEEIERHLDINARGVMLGTRLAAAPMVRQGSGHIITIGSLASLAPVPGIGLYSASKYAVRAFCLVAARELREHGVYVTVVCPDATQSPMLDLQLDYREAAMTFTAPRVLTAAEVAREMLSPRVQRRKPFEVWIPRSRGWLAKVVDVAPRLGFTLGDLLQRRGRARQLQMRGDRS